MIRKRVVLVGLVVALGACSSDSSDPEAFCAAMDRFGALNVLDLAPEEGPEAVSEAKALFDEALSTAPAEIRSSYELIMDAFIPLLDVFEAADFGRSPVDEAALGEAGAYFGSDQVQAASSDVERWMDTNCPAK